MDEHRHKLQVMEALVRMRALGRNRAMLAHERELALLRQAQQEQKARRKNLENVLEHQRAALRAGAAIDPALQDHRLLAMEAARRAVLQSNHRVQDVKAACELVRERLVRHELELEVANRARNTAAGVVQYHRQQAEAAEIFDGQLRKGGEISG